MIDNEIYLARYDNEICLGCYYSEICFGLRRRNNELHELTNFVAALGASETTKYIWPQTA